MASAPPPTLFDRLRRARRLERTAARFATADFLHRRVAEGFVDSLSAILRDFPVAVDLSARPGVFADVLKDSPGADRIGRVSTPGSLADRGKPGASPLALEDASADLIVSILSLHWADDLPGALSQIRRVLKPDGLFQGALFGAGTLKELRGVLTEAELELRGGAQPRVSPFADGFDGAALLQRAGFALPVSDVDRVTVRYRDLFALVADLRAMGETSALVDKGLPLTREIVARAAQLYVQRHGEPDGRIPASFEIVSLAGWAPHASQQQPLARGSAKVRLADVLGVREQTGED